MLTSDRHPARIAAAISHEFVAIHPFPDFNGRVSRLLLAAALFAASVPFAVTLRGDKRGQAARYRQALRRADNGNIEPFAGLIARRVVETFQEIDRNLIRAGVTPLRAPEPESSTDD